jgi:hypothetical protein
MRPLKKEYTERATMSVPADPVKIQEAMRELGVLPADVEKLQRMAVFEEATAWLDELKDRVRKNFKRLAFELHPDRTGGDLEKTALFKLYGTVKDDFEKLQVQRRPQLSPSQVVFQHMAQQIREQERARARRPPIQPPPRVVMWSSVGSTVANRAGTVSIAFGVPLRVATMKPT